MHDYLIESTMITTKVTRLSPSCDFDCTHFTASRNCKIMKHFQVVYQKGERIGASVSHISKTSIRG